VTDKEVTEVAEAAETTTVQTTMVERVTVSEHYLAVENVAVRPPERRARPRSRVFAAGVSSRAFQWLHPSRRAQGRAPQDEV
jgi:hypothetical protein